MKENNSHSAHFTERESFLMSLLNKVVKEYKTLREMGKHTKPLKIVEIFHLSSIPGETKFAIQITNKNYIVHLTCAEIINNGYSLNEFSDYHANIIRQSAQGKLIEFLQLSDTKIPLYKVVSKKLDRETQQYIFTIETKNQLRFDRTLEELHKEREILENMNVSDIYDIGFTQGSESILKEKTALVLAKKGNQLT